jgi:hypothetical protein
MKLVYRGAVIDAGALFNHPGGIKIKPSALAAALGEKGGTIELQGSPLQNAPLTRAMALVAFPSTLRTPRWAAWPADPAQFTVHSPLGWAPLGWITATVEERTVAAIAHVGSSGLVDRYEARIFDDAIDALHWLAERAA